MSSERDIIILDEVDGVLLNGNGRPLSEARTVLVEATTEAATVIQVADATVFPLPPFQIRIGDEILAVTNCNDGRWRVQRGHAGTQPVDHPSGTPVLMEPYWRPLVDECFTVL